MQQNLDPREAGIDWAQFRESQRDPARASVASALALDEIARYVEERRISTLWLPAALFQTMVEYQLDRLGGVRQLLAGGDARDRRRRHDIDRRVR